MRGFIQFVCVFALAVGAGSFAFGRHLEPQLNPLDPASVGRVIDSYAAERQHMTAAGACGFGLGCIMLGAAGLLVPLVNKISFSELGESSGKIPVVITIWISLTLILTLGVFRQNWTGSPAVWALLTAVGFICAAATGSTAIVCGWTPRSRVTPILPEVAR